MKKLYFAALAAIIGLGCQVNANAQETILGLTDGNQIVSVQSDLSTAGAAVPVTGLVAGDNLVGIDYRGTTGDLFAIGRQNNVYSLDTTTFMASLVGNFFDGVNDDQAGPGALSGTDFAFDFNPAFTPDASANASGSFARIISDTTLNRVINSNTGEYLGGAKTDVFYNTGDTNEGTTPNLQGIAYTNSFPGSTVTTQFGIDIVTDSLVTVANNAGTLNTVIGLGLDAEGDVGFDISGFSGTGYATFTTGTAGASQLHTVDLGTGAVSLVGDFGVANNIRSLTVVSAVPEPGSLAFLAMGVVAIASRRRRK